MIAVIFAAGIGSRLRPFTEHHPKALAPVAGVPALVRVADKLRQAGARRIIVNIHHFPNQVVECLRSLPYAADIDISDESGMLLDTGGALAKIWRENDTLRRAATDEDIVVHNADIITDFDIADMCEARRRVCADVALLVDPQRQSTRRFLFDSNRVLAGWENTAKGEVRPSGLVTSGLMPAPFGGVHVLLPAVMEAIASGAPAKLQPFSIVDWYLDNCSIYKIYGFSPDYGYRWHDIGTPEKLAAADRAFA